VGAVHRIIHLTVACLSRTIAKTRRRVASQHAHCPGASAGVSSGYQIVSNAKNAECSIQDRKDRQPGEPDMTMFVKNDSL